MIACIDVGYGETDARAACATFDGWTDAVPKSEVVLNIDSIEPYVPGQFYLRELPCLLAVLEQLPSRPVQVIVDGYVWLDENGRRGLGAHLFDSLGGDVPVIGVAKTSFQTATNAIEVFRGDSTRPLYVTSAGVADQVAADYVASMHGDFRMPTLLRRVDQLSRGEAS